MRKILTLVLLGALAFSFVGCEKNDYKHPLHRANGG